MYLPPPPEILTEKQQARIEVLKDVSSILLEVYKDRIALYEVNAAIYSEFYEDETVLLKDLLYPEWSRLYQTEKFKARKPRTGVFRSKFIDQFNKAEYPHLRKALGNSVGQFELNGLSSPSPNIPDTAMEIFTNSAGVNIYFPYSENFVGNFTPTWFDNINDIEGDQLATIVSADRDADSGPGQSPYRFNGSNTNTPEIRYRTVTVNDSYAETRMTHIIGIGAEPTQFLEPPPPIDPPGINRVFIGDIRGRNKQWDKFINFAGNGGGSEIKICRISGYLQPVNGQVTTFQDITSVHLKRKDIRKEKWKRIYEVWDDDWAQNDLEQVFVVYEDDNGASTSITGSLSTTLKVDSNLTITGSIGFTITKTAQDEIIRQLKISRNSYFNGAYQDQGHGFRPDLSFIPPPATHGWPIFDGGSDFSWTWPYNSY